MRHAAHTRVPKYCHHKGRDLAYVYLNGRMVYLPGRYGSDESRREYDRIIGLWQLNGRRLPDDTVPGRSVSLSVTSNPNGTTLQAPSGKTVDQLIEAFLAEAEKEYPARRGYRNSELSCIETASLLQVIGAAVG